MMKPVKLNTDHQKKKLHLYSIQSVLCSVFNLTRFELHVTKAQLLNVCSYAPI